MDLGRDEEAEKLLVDLADQNAQDDYADAIALVVRARLLGRRGQLAGARSALHEALERLPPLWLLTRTEARVEQINMLKEAGLDGEAALAAEAALSDTKLSPDPLYDLMINEALQGRGSTSGSVDAQHG